MKKTVTGVCIAAAFGFVVSVGAQTTTSGTTAATTTTSDSHDLTVVGCLQRGSDGNYLLTNARMDGANDRSSATGTTGTTSSTTTSGSTTSSTPRSTSPATTATWSLRGGNDLDKHVGHTIQVTGRALAAGGSEADTTAGTTGSTASASGTSSTTGTSGSATTTTPDDPQSSTSSAKKLDVKSVKMIASSCS